MLVALAYNLQFLVPQHTTLVEVAVEAVLPVALVEQEVAVAVEQAIKRGLRALQILVAVVVVLATRISGGKIILGKVAPVSLLFVMPTVMTTP